MIRNISTALRIVWIHRSWQVDRWHLASRELVSGRVEKLALKVVRCEDMKR
jgi:hypothetical protein